MKIWFERLVEWNNRTKKWNWALIWLLTGCIALVLFVAYYYYESYRITTFQNHVYCEVLKEGMSADEVDVALDRIGNHIQADISNQIALNIEPNPTYYRLVIFDDANIHVRMGLGYDKNERLLWVTRGEISPDQIVQCQ